MSASVADIAGGHVVGGGVESLGEQGLGEQGLGEQSLGEQSLGEHSLVAGWTATTAADPDEPVLRDGVDPEDVSPGVLGFLVIFAVVLACIPLFRSMTSKLRGVEHRARREGPADELPADELPADEVPGTRDAPGA